MGSMANDDIDARIGAGRKQIEIAQDPERGETEPRRVPPAAIAAGVGAAIIGLGLIGWMIYRSRRRPNVIKQLQDALPSRVSAARELGVGLRDRGLVLGQEVRGRGIDLRDELRGRVRRRTR